MRGVPMTFWGKLQHRGDIPAEREWRPLFDHRADVAEVAEGLLSPRAWQQRLISLARRERDMAEQALSGSQAEAGT